MTRTEERLAAALAAAARAVPEESLRPLVAPERREPRHRPGWLAPVAAALGVILVIGLAMLASRLTSRSGGPAIGLPPGVPRYYVETSLTTARPVVRSTSTGAITSTIPIPATASTPGYLIPPGYPIVAVDADGTYFMVAYSPAARGERLYQFQVTPAGRVTGFAALPWGRLAGSSWAADALAVSPDGSQIAVGMHFSGPAETCGGPGKRACPRSRSDYIMAIDVSTGARTVWRNEAGAPSPWFSVDSLSWTTRGELVFLGQWCRQSFGPEQCGSSLRTAEVRALNPASGGGRVDSGRLLLIRTARVAYPLQALISPDGATITAVMVQGRMVANRHISDMVPPDMYVARISAIDGQPLTVLYHRRLGNVSEVNYAPDFLALSQDASGQHFMLNIGLCAGHCTDGANGWIHDGRLVPLTPVNGREGDQAW
jgi:hypothetical protein